MPASFIENDITHMLASSDFGEASGSVTWKGNAVDAIFDDEDVELTLGEGVGQIIPQPMLTGKTADFPSIADGDAVVADGRNFVVKNWKRDGTGEIEIFLEEQV